MPSVLARISMKELSCSKKIQAVHVQSAQQRTKRRLTRSIVWELISFEVL